MSRSKNEWHLILSIGRDYIRINRGWKLFQFGIMKPTFNWPEGTEMRKPYYKGFLFRFYFWWPIERY